jgi:mono/diheme cytochrome c family protein
MACLNRRLPLLALALFCMPLVVPAQAVPEQAVLEQSVSREDGKVPFEAVRRILADNCFVCHGPDGAKRRGGAEGGDGMRLDTAAGLRQPLDSGVPVEPWHPGRSELLRRITATGDDRMPPPGKGAGLPKEQIALIERWIAQGAVAAPHWSYVPPRRTTMPVLPDDDVTHPVDQLVQRMLRRHGLQQAPAADRRTLVRRLALDLTGLPATLEATERFVSDASPDAYERLVDRLLAQPTFGEHWARPWLDLARYADSAGYADDPLRTIWAWRDWVIRAFNDNMPFDQFTIEQIAGDLLPEPTDDQLVATAFHRNTMTNSEGGTDDEEFRTAAVVDRVCTTMSVWMGATVACAQCHSHKYDQLTHTEFYQLFAFFNGTDDADRRNEKPTLPLFSSQQQDQLAKWQAELVSLETTLDAKNPKLRASIAAWIQSFPRSARWQNVPVASVDAGEDTLMLRTVANDREIEVTALQFRAAEDAEAIAAVVLPIDVAAPVLGRFVRITLPGKTRNLHLAEVQVWQGATNLAPAGQARQSSTAYDRPARLAIDGNTDGHFNKVRSTTHTATSNDPWWEVDLGSAQEIHRIAVWNRTDSKAVRQRLHDFRIEVLDAERVSLWHTAIVESPNPSVDVATRRITPIELGATYRDPAGTWNTILREPLTLAKGQRIELRVRGLSSTAEQPEHIALSDDSHFAAYADASCDVLAGLAHDGKTRSKKQLGTVTTGFLEFAPELTASRERRAKVRAKIAGRKPHTTVPIMRQRAEPRATHIHLRGDHRSPGEAVTVGVPGAFHPLPEDAPRDRLALARWLVAPDNPRTARVFVNHVWAELFGTGIVATRGDFGVQGELPTHPKLLDWLAVEFVASGWDIKALLRQIVCTATYRQSSRASADLLRRDPDNRLLARGARFRLSAEMIRDAALHVSGLLSPKMYGPPVRPLRPNLGLRAAFGGSTDWKTSGGEDRHRRGLYTTWRRSLPYPSMVTFDAPSREVCTTARIRTNTPLQALVTLNDPVYVEAAQSLARRILVEGGVDTRARASYGFRLCLQRPPSAQEADRLIALHDQARARFAATPEQALRFATDPIGAAPKHTDLADLAAWTLVSNVLLNLDEFLVKI